MIKIIVSAVLAILVGVAIYGAYQYPLQIASLGSPVGTTFSTRKMAAVNMTPSTSAASSTAVLNSDASARWVTSVDVACTGAGTSNAWPSTGGGLANLLLQMATSSTAAQSGNANLAANVTVATTSVFSQSASSTIATAVSTATDLYYWPAGVYMVYTFNATNTAACTVSANYLPS